jgi:hypothetical protein
MPWTRTRQRIGAGDLAVHSLCLMLVCFGESASAFKVVLVVIRHCNAGKACIRFIALSVKVDLLFIKSVYVGLCMFYLFLDICLVT